MARILAVLHLALFIGIAEPASVSSALADQGPHDLSSWNSFLDAKNIFDASIDRPAGLKSTPSVLEQLAAILDQPGMMQHLYQNYLHRFNKGEAPILDGSNMTRVQLFKIKLLDIANHNLKFRAGSETWWKGVNQFSDMTSDERRSFLPESIELEVSDEELARQNATDHLLPSLVDAPATKDWRDDGIVTPVRKQGLGCKGGRGSCYTFTATGTAEAAWARKTGEMLDLSEMELVDCDRKNNGCNGGVTKYSYEYMVNGLALEDDYPYAGSKDEGADRTCKAEGKKHFAPVATHDLRVKSDEATLQKMLLEFGPVAVSLGADANAWSFDYSGGVYRGPCNPKINHGVVLVGYTETDWIMKNSWGEDWGEKGYIRFPRGENKCMIANQFFYITAMG